MLRTATSSLIDFCVSQRGHFSAKAWLTPPSGVSREELAVVALNLASTREFIDHREELLCAAATLSPGCDFAALVEKTGFEPSRFTNLLKAHLNHACVS